MNLTLSDLYYPLKEKYSLSLITEAHGLNKPVSWVSVLENIDAFNFSHKSELAITAGLFPPKNPGWLKKIAETLISHGCMALIAITGNHINDADFDSGIKSFCTANDFTIISMPSTVNIAAAVQDFCSIIISGQYNDGHTAEYLRTLITEPEKSSAVIPSLKETGFSEDENYRVCIIESNTVPSLFQWQLNCKLIRYISYTNGSFFVFILKNAIYGRIYEAVCQYFDSVQPEAYAGIGYQTSNLSKLTFSYNSAIEALKEAKLNKKHYVFYDELGIYRILHQVPDLGLLDSICMEKLKILLDYDRENHTDLTKTLSAYILCDGSVNQAAIRLYLHRNTVNYRMSVIRKLLGSDLHSETERFDYRMAIYILNMK